MNGSTYYQECPVALSHSQLGLSIGGSADSICNICGVDPWNCDHIKGYKYDGVVMRKITGVCNICTKEKCDHQVDQIYDNVMAFHFLINLKMDEVSLVKNPANPLARIHSYTLSAEEIREALPKNQRASFVPGETIINCDHCVDCDGEDK
jgi:hypothetical protein